MSQIRLSQALFVMNTAKENHLTRTSEIHHLAQKPEPLNGFLKVYQRTDDTHVPRHPEAKNVQMILTDAIKEVIGLTQHQCDAVATRDYGNVVAKADVVVNGTVILKDVPPTFLMHLAKQLEDLRTFFGKCVTLDQSVTWKLNEQTNLYEGPEEKTNSTDKVIQPLVLYAATDKHPAQTDKITRDVVVGVWTSTRHSGAIPHTEKLKYLARVDVLHKAVQDALNECNAAKVERKENLTADLFKFLVA